MPSEGSFHDEPQPTGVPSEITAPGNPTRWHDADGEHHMVWTAEVEHVADALRSIAALLDADPDLVLLAFTNSPAEPSDPMCSIVQAHLTRSFAGET